MCSRTLLSTCISFPPMKKVEVPLFLVEIIILWNHFSYLLMNLQYRLAILNHSLWGGFSHYHLNMWRPHLNSLWPTFPSTFFLISHLTFCSLVFPFQSKSSLFLLSRFPAFHSLLNPREFRFHLDQSNKKFLIRSPVISLILNQMFILQPVS